MSDEEPPALTRHTSRLGLRIAAGCALLIGLAFIQTPGFLLADTKFDLAVDPAGFLGRALHLWDEEGAFGQLQNQAYGYLWPMGPFFLLGSLLDVPGWVVQRLWQGLVMSVAFAGTARLARAMGVRSDAAALIAGFAFATSPRLLSTLGPISIEAWPSAMAPWVLLPLVLGSRSGSPRRAALWAGLAVAMVGGVNAAATFAVIPLGVVWLLTRERGRRRNSMMLWWPVFTLLATLWWLVPLFVMGAYSPPFLDFIETASVTTFPTTLFDALRGTSAWVPYIDPSWQGGNETISTFYLALNSGVVLMLGLVGILLRGHGHRQFLLLSVLTGLFMVTLGHLGAVEGWFATDLNALLDGALAPLRNVHKFDPVIRLPMVLGLALMIDAAMRSSTVSEVEVGRRTLRLSSTYLYVGLALVAVVGASVPAWTAKLAPTRPVLATPGYWGETSDWLAANSSGGVALLAPGSGFGDYLWGAPRDEPMQHLADSRWAVRNAIPLAPPGNIRMLDAVESRLNQGRASSGLATYLRRAGVEHVVVRNDLRPADDVPDAALVHQALENSPGIDRVARFGPDVGGEANLVTEDSRIVINGGWQDERPALEVYAVQGEVKPAVSAADLPVVLGGPEDLIDLSDHGVLGTEPTQLAMDVEDDAVPDGPVLLTDGYLDRERFFGRVHDSYSSVRTPGDRSRSGNPTADFQLSDDDARWRTTARLVGAKSITASSSRSDANAAGGVRPGELPFAALDGSVESVWVSGNDTGDPWWQVDLVEDAEVDEVTVTTGSATLGQVDVQVSTEAGTSDPIRLEGGETRRIVVPSGITSWVRVAEVSGASRQLSLAEVVVPGLEVRRELHLPAVPPEWEAPAAILLRALGDARTGCVVIDSRVPCQQSKTRAAEEPLTVDRVVDTSDGVYNTSMTARPLTGDAQVSTLQDGLLTNVAASSSAVPDLRASALATIDGDPGTTWIPTWDDITPQLSLTWLGRRPLRSIAVGVDRDAPARRPTQVRIIWPDGDEVVDLDENGRADFDEPIRTNQVLVRVLAAENAGSVDSSGIGAQLPIGIGELRLSGLPLEDFTLSQERRSWGCGTGPSLEVNGISRRTRVLASPAEIYAGGDVEVESCGGEDVNLIDGANAISMSAGTLAAPSTLLLERTDGVPTSTSVARADVSGSGPAATVVTPLSEGTVLALRQNSNAGWLAHQAGRALDPVVVDGWQQGWRTDGSVAPVTAEFAPDLTYRRGLFGGLFFVVLLLGIALVPHRRWLGKKLPAVGAASMPAVPFVGIGLMTAGVLGGWVGLACAVGGALIGLLGRRTPDTAPWLVGALLWVASFAYFARPWGSIEGWGGSWAWPAYLVLVALGAAVVMAAGRRPRFLSRMKGSSTNR